jgi:hypothetical protein
MLQSRTRRIGYWITTGLVALALGSGGVGDVLRVDDIVAGMVHLGYPVYFCVILGVWKLLGAATLLAPGLPRLKEWAYAGAVFDFTGAVLSHAASGDPVTKMIAPLVLAGLTLASWALRPPERMLGRALLA